MKILHTDMSKAIGYNYKNPKKPFYLLEDVKVAISYASNKKKRFTMEKGFVSDGCTLPKVLRLFFGCQHTPEYLSASYIHDWAITHPEVFNYNRKFTSKIFLTELLVSGVSPRKAYRMYLGVELWQSFSNLWRHKWR